MGVNRKNNGDQQVDRQELLANPVLSKAGSLKALNFILDVAKGRKRAANFIWDNETGTLIEATSGKEIEVVYKGGRK